MNATQRIGRVMMIDDEEVDQMMYRRILLRSGLADDVIGFTSAEEALDYLVAPDSAPVDLILLDINMPRMTGFDFLEAVKETIGLSFSIPIVMMLTTSLNPEDRARAAECPIVRAYVNKPLCADDLSQAVDILTDLRTN